MKKSIVKNFRANLRFRPDFKLTLDHGSFRNKEKQEKVASRILKSLIKNEFIQIDIDYNGDGLKTIKAWREYYGPKN